MISDSLLAEEIRRFADREAIRAVLNRYCRLVDARDPNAIAEQAFTPEANDDHGIYGKVFRGRDEIEAMFATSNKTTDSSAHFLSNSVIELDRDVARSRTYVTGWTWVWATSGRGAVRPADWVFTGIYVDRLERTEHGWMISERLIEPLGPGATGYGVRPEAYDKPEHPAITSTTTTGAP